MRVDLLNALEKDTSVKVRYAPSNFFLRTGERWYHDSFVPSATANVLFAVRRAVKAREPRWSMMVRFRERGFGERKHPPAQPFPSPSR